MTKIHDFSVLRKKIAKTSDFSVLRKKIAKHQKLREAASGLQEEQDNTKLRERRDTWIWILMHAINHSAAYMRRQAFKRNIKPAYGEEGSL